MKTTSLEKLIQADLILRVQQRYSHTINKRMEELDERTRFYQKYLKDEVQKEELIRASKSKEEDVMILQGSEAIPRYLFATDLLNEQKGICNMILQDHEEWRNNWKDFKENKILDYKMLGVKALIADKELSASRKDQKSITETSDRINYLKNFLIGFNRNWMNNIGEKEAIFKLMERAEARRKEALSRYELRKQHS